VKRKTRQSAARHTRQARHWCEKARCDTDTVPRYRTAPRVTRARCGAYTRSIRIAAESAVISLISESCESKSHYACIVGRRRRTPLTVRSEERVRAVPDPGTRRGAARPATRAPRRGPGRGRAPRPPGAAPRPRSGGRRGRALSRCARGPRLRPSHASRASRFAARDRDRPVYGKPDPSASSIVWRYPVARVTSHFPRNACACATARAGGRVPSLRISPTLIHSTLDS